MPRREDDPVTTPLRLFLTHEHACPYLPGRRARNLVADPEAETGQAMLYDALIHQGFRRSGEYVYRPHCAACAACIPIRIPVDAFRMRRYQRRIWQRNRDLAVQTLEPGFHTSHYELYKRYLRARHPESPMLETSETDYASFLVAPWGETRFYEFNDGESPLAVAITDRVHNALSAVYTFFDPHLTRRSLGTFAILWQIEQARREGVPWLYLGYWVPGCREMAYKTQFQPCETFGEGAWTRHDAGPETAVSPVL